MSDPRAAVIVFPGSNGDRDLLEALRAAGFDSFPHPSGQPLPDDVALAGLPGGFSYGDYWRAGMLASQEPAVRSLSSLIDRGGLVIGVCNGFQILVEAGLLPGALSYNDPAGFRHRWVTVRCALETDSPWFRNVPNGATLRLPIAHGEGSYFHPGGFDAVASHAPLLYEENPNGSMGALAALLDDTGRVLGIMPHPERASDPDLGSEDGLSLFTGAFGAVARHPSPVAGKNEVAAGAHTS
ncbi:MAG: phosphoribosylformylglycinamidine synthase I [Actinomycetota bacterium]|nr:phosphoribosylformylglycinamidine synthase I [Actinomycetota bacterium]